MRVVLPPGIIARVPRARWAVWVAVAWAAWAAAAWAAAAWEAAAAWAAAAAMGGGMGGGGMGGRGGGTMPPMQGMMTLANLIMYFCGDVDSWDRRP